MKDNVIVACAQTFPEFGNTARNLKNIISIIRETDADLIVFPELATSGYNFNNRREVSSAALEINGKEIDSLTQTACDHNRHVVIGIPESNGGKVYNSSILIEPNGKISTYRKIHLFDNEKHLFDSGDKPFFVQNTAIGKLGMMICFDWIFPESARLLALMGAQIICHPSNLVLSFCQQAMFARSVENGVFTMTCNRIGEESNNYKTLTFTGGSQILSPKGVALAKAPVDSEEVIQAEISPSDADNKQITANNHLFMDRRTDFYGDLLK